MSSLEQFASANEIFIYVIIRPYILFICFTITLISGILSQMGIDNYNPIARSLIGQNTSRGTKSDAGYQTLL